MFGALIGDCIGSFWEFSGNKDPQIPLWVPACRFTDDSICTVAVADWLLDGEPLAAVLRRRALDNLDRGFGPKMRRWVMDSAASAYQSWGNGSAMRVSATALWAKDEEDLLRLARESALPTHDSEEGIRAAQATAFAIRWAFERGPRELLAEVERRFGYEGLAQIDPDKVRPGHIYDVSARGTVPLALAIALRGADFAAVMRACCSMGGDADTLAAIAGPVSEALHGIPQEHFDNAHLRYAGTSLWNTIERVYRDPVVAARLKAWGHFGALPETTSVRVPPLRLKFKPQ